MLIRNLTAEHVYLACGRTDMRKSIDGLAALVLSKFQLDPHQPALFLFCGRRKDRIKGLLWDETGFLLLYKRLSVSMAGYAERPAGNIRAAASLAYRRPVHLAAQGRTKGYPCIQFLISNCAQRLQICG